MPVYTQYGPWSNGAAPGLSAAALNGIENQLLAVQYGFNILATPYLLVNNVTIAVGVTNTYTATGGATGVTAGAKAVFVNVFYTPSVTATSARFSPHSIAWSAGLYPEVGESSTGAAVLVAGSVLVQVDVNGQFDVKANTGALQGLYVGITGFIY